MPLLDRITTEASAFTRRVFGASGGTGTSAAGDGGGARGHRHDAWALRDQMLAGTAYLPTGRGSLGHVLRELGKPCDEANNPVVDRVRAARQIVKFYDLAVGGQWGAELRPVLPGTTHAAADELAGALSRVWRWSNLNARKSEIAEVAANQGSVGIRVVYQSGPSPRVYLAYDDPRWVKRLDLDERDNVSLVRLEYNEQTYNADGTDEKTLPVVEVIAKGYRSRMVDGVETVPPDDRENGLGVCPYVWLTHESVPGSPFGRHAYAGSERAIWSVDWGLSQVDDATRQAIEATWFMTSPAPKPTKFVLSKTKLVYSRTQEGQPQPTLNSLVPQVDIAAVTSFVMDNMDLLRSAQPELLLNSVKLISGVSGETLAQILKPAESACLSARQRYEDSLVRALQIAVSVGIYNQIPGFDLGTGTGTRQAAESAYDDGQGPETFAFAARPALPLTPAARVQIAQADVAADKAKAELAAERQGLGVSNDEVFRSAGYSQADVDKIQAERALDEAEAALAGTAQADAATAIASP